MARWWQRWRWIVLGLLVGLLAFFHLGRSLWHPLVVRAIGGVTLSERITGIGRHQPDLLNLHPTRVEIWIFKHDRRLDVWLDGKRWESYPIQAASGKLGPKIQRGDRQVPEGAYRIDALNPNSSFHVSLRVSYPNDEDRERGSRLGVTDPGDDIYIHGGSASIGCIAIGDDAAERLFYVVQAAGIQAATVCIAPVDFSAGIVVPLPDHAALYADLRARQLARYGKPPGADGR